MNVRIISLKGIQFEGAAQSVNVKTAAGEITVLDHHLPLLTILTRGDLILTDSDGAKQAFPVTGGFLEVDPYNTLTALVD